MTKSSVGRVKSILKSSAVRVKPMLKASSFWFALTALALLTAGIWLTWWQWDWFRSGGSETASNGDTLRNAGLMLGGVVALIFALWRGWVAEQQSTTASRQADIAQQGLLNERYERGAEMLGSAVLAVRLGGIYALRRLAEEYPQQYHVQVMLLFCAFVRNPVELSGLVESPTIETEPPHSITLLLREDVQAILNAISVRTRKHIGIEGKARFQLNLSGSDLRGANLTGANLNSAPWEYPNEISKSELLAFDRYTDLSGVQLCSAKLVLAELQKASLTGACLCDAWLGRTDLSEANLTDARLHGALSWGPILSGTRFSINGNVPAKGVGQSDLDSCVAEPGKPPDLSGVLDAETGKPLVWSGKPLIEQG